MTRSREHEFSSEHFPVVCRAATPTDVAVINEFYKGEYGAEYPSFVKVSDLEDLSRIVVVAVEEGGTRVIGVGQATPWRSGSDIYEVKGLVVDARYRGQKIGKLLLQERLRILQERGISVVCSEPVCRKKGEGRSQNNLLREGFALTGILPLKYPDELVVNNQPESVGMAFKFLVGESGWGTRPIYLPEDYKAVLLSTVAPSGGQGERVLGEMPEVVEFPPEVAEGREGAAFVEVPINWPGALHLIEKFQQQGYLLAGLIPGVHKNSAGNSYDAVIMYRPPVGVQIDFDHIYVVEPLRDLHKFMREEYREKYS